VDVSGKEPVGRGGTKTVAESVISFDEVSLGYGKRLVLQGLTFDIQKGECLGVIGPNGAGKTTLLRGVLGLVRPRAGSISAPGTLHYGYVMQRQFLDTLFPFTVADIVRMGRFGRKRAWARLNRKDREQVEDALEITGLTDLRDALYRELSGGQRQSVAIARAILFNARILIMDEPTAALGPQETEQVGELIHRLKEDGIGIFLISHDIHDVFDLADRVAVMKNGQMVGYAKTKDVTKDEVLGMIILGKCPAAATPGPGASTDF